MNKIKITIKLKTKKKKEKKKLNRQASDAPLTSPSNTWAVRERIIRNPSYKNLENQEANNIKRKKTT